MQRPNTTQATRESLRMYQEKSLLKQVMKHQMASPNKVNLFDSYLVDTTIRQTLNQKSELANDKVMAGIDEEVR